LSAIILTVFYSAVHEDPQSRQDFRYPIDLATAPCRFGGLRYWFICPASKNGVPCWRRVVKLYLPPGAVYFVCRHCHGLTYRSCQEHDARVDWLAKNPLLLQQMLEGKDGSWSKRFLALKAAFKLREI